MIDGLIAGKLLGSPERRTDKNGKPFVVAKVIAAAGEGDGIIVNVISFDGLPARPCWICKTVTLWL